MNLEQLLDELTPMLPAWLAPQRWFSSDEEPPASARFVQHELWSEQSPMLLWALVETNTGALYQTPIGLRVAGEEGGVLLGHGHALIGQVHIDDQTYVAYDALVDPALGLAYYDKIADGGAEPIKSARPIGVEQSNTSIVLDNRIILKVFRRLYEGANPDLEVTKKLTDAGFSHVAPVLLLWERGELDLAVGQPYLYDGTEGWKLALASVRDYFGADTQGATSTAGSPTVRIDTNNPAMAGGDFGDEAERLGVMTAGLHIALADNFPTETFDPNTLADSLLRSLHALSETQQAALHRLVDDLRQVPAAQAGLAMRIHGDYHLGQTLRSVSGWFVFDFEGEPARPLSERIHPTSPLKDVAGMFRSFQYAAATGLFEQMPADREHMQDRAAAWELRNRDAFRTGYLSVPGTEKFIPNDEVTARLLLTGFEVEKAIYELGYERAYRPEWTPIPEIALTRLLA